MPTLSDARDKVRKDLHDTDAAAYRWTDTQLDRHLDHALALVSDAMPIEKRTTLATTAGSREVSLAALSDLLEVERVEYPTGEYPPAYVDFATWSTSLMLHVDDVPTGANLQLFYLARHTLDGSGTTLSAQQLDLVAMGAGAFAALEQSVYAADRLTTNTNVAAEYAAWGRARETAFHQLLMQQGRRGRLRTRRAYLPA